MAFDTATTISSELYREMKDNIPLLAIMANVTDDCNLRCKYCFTSRNPRNASLDTFKKAVEFLCLEKETKGKNTKDTPNLCFFGGEPLLRYNDIILPILEWSKEQKLNEKYGMNFSVTTNGTLLNEERLKQLSEYRVGLLLSMDGDKDIQDDQRPGNGFSSFDILVEKIPLILKYFPDVTFRSTIEPRNANKMVESYLFARRMGFRNYYNTPNAFPEWSQEEITDLLQNVAMICAIQYRDIVMGQTPLYFSPLNDMMGKVFKGPPKVVDTRFRLNRCAIGFYSIGMAANGDLKVCHEHNTCHERDIWTIGDIWNGIDENRHINFLNNYLSKPIPTCLENPERCNNCSIRDYCVMPGCHSREWDISKQPGNIPIISCIWNEFLYQQALLLLESSKKLTGEEKIRFLQFIKYFGGGIENGE